ncbi:MAG: glycoside hydrolase family 2 protein [Bacteroidota bacterium]
MNQITFLPTQHRSRLYSSRSTLFSFLFLFIFFAATNLSAQNTERSGTLITKLDNFSFCKSGTKEWYPAKVPGTVHTDLYKNNLISDPFYSNNEEQLQWIEKDDWIYKTRFYLSPEVLKRDRIELVFDGLDTYTQIKFNGKKIGTTNNMFVQWVFDVKQFAKDSNTLEILFYSPTEYALSLFSQSKYVLPAGNDRGDPKTSVYTRKAPYQYGWDWGPRFVTSGIWRPAYIRSWNLARISDVYFLRGEVNADEAVFTAQMETESLADATATITILVNGQFATSKETEFRKGLNKEDLEFRIFKPVLWWPNGMGKQQLYTVQCVIEVANRKDTLTKRIAVRDIQFINTRDMDGTSFYFKVNGIPVFMKGANHVPLNHFTTEVTDEKYRQTIKMATDVNMNMLRVWGGGIYENDIFYDLCDENGILVWQDFMFAGSLYPWDAAFMDNVKAEAEYNVRRLRNHACLALWCGNNEIEEGWNHWGWQRQYSYSPEDTAAIWNGYKLLFRKLLPDIENKLDTQSAYWPSSPQYGWGNKESYRSGDSHYWGVWWGNEPFENYKEKTGRFASEYGFQAMPELNTFLSFTGIDQLSLDSAGVKNHQKHPTGYKTILSYMKQYLAEPVNFREMIYLSQLLQAEGMRIAIESHRNSKPICMGSLFWQLSDTWPVTSWSCFDYNLKPKAFYYQLKELFAPVLLSATLMKDNMVVTINSELQRRILAKLIIKLYNFDGKLIGKDEKTIHILPNTPSAYQVWNLPNSFKMKDTTRCFATVELSEDSLILAHSNIYFARPGSLKIPPAIMNVTTEKKNNQYIIHLRAVSFVKSIYLSTLSSPGVFSENFFDLLPGQAKDVIFTPAGNYSGELLLDIITMNEFLNKKKK